MNSRLTYLFLFTLLLCGGTAVAASDSPSKAALFFCRIGKWVDDFNLRGLDTTYITLPEHSWRVALNNGEVGINSTYTTWLDPSTPVMLHMQTTPSLGLGFNVGYRSLGGGYSWDLLNSYTTNWNISMGSKMIGLEFVRNVSTNLTGNFHIDDRYDQYLPKLNKGDLRMSYTSLSAWYALNSEHYSHQAAIKQSYIQKRSAGSILLSLSYMHTQMALQDTFTFHGVPILAIIMDSVKSITTHQVAVGLGYGINYTPNKGKVLLHAAANLQLVCYSINQLTLALDSSIVALLPGEARFNIHPQYPVHVTGNVRAAVSWEINRWVHLSAWAQANNIRFRSKETELTEVIMRNWNWQVHLNLGVRFGAGRQRVLKALEDLPPLSPSQPIRTSKLPQWIIDYFYSPSL